MTKKILSILLAALGIGIFIFGSNMSEEAAVGEERVSNSEENLQEQRRPVFGPIRRGIRADARENAQEKIGDAEQKIVKSQVTANWLQGTGAVVFVVGMGCFILSFSRKKRR